MNLLKEIYNLTKKYKTHWRQNRVGRVYLQAWDRAVANKLRDVQRRGAQIDALAAVAAAAAPGDALSEHRGGTWGGDGNLKTQRQKKGRYAKEYKNR